jgi:flavin-dependent dehydrogenase
MPHDVLIVGGGPAGCVAAIVLARAGARIAVIDRATFPRDKLCGDTVNPGALAILRGLALEAAESGLPIAGMLVTGPRGARVTALYPQGATGRSIVRRDLDRALLQSAADAGAEVREGTLVSRLLVDGRGGVDGVMTRAWGGKERAERARIVIAADGRGSRLSRGVALSRAPRRPRRWAVGAYFANVGEVGSVGEMHVRPGHYIGVAPLAGGLVNVCVVTADRGRLRDPAALLTACLRDDWALAHRFARAERVTAPVTLGPLAVDCPVPGRPGLLLAGDAAGFIDPMTGDGLRFALRGAELAAAHALRYLDAGTPNLHLDLAAARRREFAGKWRFNRALRTLVSSPTAVHLAALATRVTAAPLMQAIGYAGDVPRG